MVSLTKSTSFRLMALWRKGDKPFPEMILTHWSRVTHIWVGNLTITVSDNGLSPGRRQAIIWTNAGILLMWTLGTNFSEILIEILIFSFKNMRLKVSSGKWRTFCLGPNVLTKIHDAIWLIGHTVFIQLVSTDYFKWSIIVASLKTYELVFI